MEVLTKDGRKLRGILTAAEADHFELTVSVKKKLPEQKRPQLVEEVLSFPYDEVKYTKYLIRFK